jgi:hypothetical protein
MADKKRKRKPQATADAVSVRRGIRRAYAEAGLLASPGYRGLGQTIRSERDRQRSKAGKSRQRAELRRGIYD